MTQVPTAETPAQTPTLAALRARATARGAKEYWFFLTSGDVQASAALGDAAVLAYALIRAAAWGPRANDWVKLTHRAADCMARGYRWWHGATSRLERAGLIEVQRQRGREPRYRLVQR